MKTMRNMGVYPIRLPDSVVEQLKRIASDKNTKPVTLARDFIVDAIAEIELNANTANRGDAV